MPQSLDRLAAGGSQAPYTLLEPFGVDPDYPGFWDSGLRIIDEMRQLEE